MVVEKVGVDEAMEDPMGQGKNFFILSNGKSSEKLKRGSNVMSSTFCRDYSGFCLANGS